MLLHMVYTFCMNETSFADKFSRARKAADLRDTDSESSDAKIRESIA